MACAVKNVGITVLQKLLHIWLGKHIISIAELLVTAKNKKKSLNVHQKEDKDIK